MRNNFRLLVLDGGYISWTYGSRRFSYFIWSQARLKYLGGVIFQDGNSILLRKQYFPDYKAHREERRNENPSRVITYEQVQNFKRLLDRDLEFTVVGVPGFEADDLIAAAALALGRIQVIGGDKDLLQISQKRMQLEKIDGTILTLEHFMRRQPKTIWGSITDTWDVILTLSILGDKSDDIPRLLAPRKLDLLIKILNARRPFTISTKIFGEDFIRNLALTLLPGPWTFDPIPRFEDLPEMIESGVFPTKLHLREDIQTIMEKVCLP